MSSPINIFWFRRDLRLNDNAGLYHALKSGRPVMPVFIFDTDILDQLDNKADRRLNFIHAVVEEMQAKLVKKGSSLQVFHGRPENIFAVLMQKYSIEKVFTNDDYEPYAIARDKKIKNLLAEKNILFQAYKDQVIFEKREIVKDDGNGYTVFTPYSRRWKAALNEFYLKAYPIKKYSHNFLPGSPAPIPSLEQMGFTATDKSFPAKSLDEALIKHYGEQRDFPGIRGTSRLGIHLRFGTVSIRQVVNKAKDLSETYLNELIWREFYQMILWHFPRVGEGRAFKPVYENIEWRRAEDEFEKWCQGQTGYPIVDAGMRELNKTGFMHNRVRMITASFLCKHLLLDWRLGEAYFAEKLLDYDLAANNGGWQWAAGSGCDAAPYFRIFNPYLQTKKFDPRFLYIKKWVPEFQEFNYPPPLVAHEFARKRCLEVYARSLRNQ